MRLCRLVALMLVISGVLALTGTAALAEKRVALVIGNSNYRHVPSLPNPARDATAIAGLLRSATFDVVEARQDLGAAELRRSVREFAAAASDADVAVVYFAGHGIEVGGTNYLIPVDARLLTDFDVEDEAVSLDRILAALEPAKKLRLVILDACRDNPFVKSIKRTVATRSIGRGLAQVEPATADTLIAFAAKAGAVANDGAGSNSPFATALLKHLAVPGLDLRIAFGRVRDEVMAMTRRQQEPFVYGSLGGEVVSLMPANAAPQQRQAAAPAQPQQRAASLAAGRDKDVEPAFEKFRGRSILLDFWEHQTEVSPRSGTWQVRKHLTVFANSETDIQSRLILVGSDPRNTAATMRTAALGATDGDLQWTIANGNLTGSWRRTGFVFKFDLKLDGSSCEAGIGYGLVPGKTSFELVRGSNKEKMNVVAITADKITCRVVRGDAILNSPLVAQ